MTSQEIIRKAVRIVAEDGYDRLTLSSLAQELGVSIATVSRALRSSPEIGKEMQQRVKELAKRLNYRPNPFARSLRREATEALQLSTSYDASTRQLTVNVLGRSSSEGGFAGNVHLWLTEDSIVSVQRLEGGGYNFEHVFNNIFRTSATPIEGSPVTIPYANEPQQVYTATVTLDDVWRPEKMAVVAFVDNSGGVANVARAAVITPGEE